MAAIANETDRVVPSGQVSWAALPSELTESFKGVIGALLLGAGDRVTQDVVPELIKVYLTLPQ